MTFGTIIRNGRWFDGTGALSAIRTIGIRVHRLTGELADWYQVDAGHLRVGDRADIVVVNPARPDASLQAYTEASAE